MLLCHWLQNLAWLLFLVRVTFLQGRNGFVRGVDTLWRQVERVGISLVGFFVLYSWVRPDHFLVMVTCLQGYNSFVGGGDTLWRFHVERVRFQHGGFLVLCSWVRPNTSLLQCLLSAWWTCKNCF